MGVTGIKRAMAELLTSFTGQRLKYFNTEYAAKEWLIENHSPRFRLKQCSQFIFRFLAGFLPTL